MGQRLAPFLGDSRNQGKGWTRRHQVTLEDLERKRSCASPPPSGRAANTEQMEPALERVWQWQEAEQLTGSEPCTALPTDDLSRWSLAPRPGRTAPKSLG